MTVAEFAEKAFYPIISRRLARNSKEAYETAFRVYINPALLGKMADQGKGEATLRRAFMLVHELFNEAVENNYVMKNPARPIALPRCKRIQEIEPPTETQVRALFENNKGRDRLMWRILLLTVFASVSCWRCKNPTWARWACAWTKAPTSAGHRPRKTEKTRCAPIPDSLRGELGDWIKTVEGELIFPHGQWDNVFSGRPRHAGFSGGGASSRRCAAYDFPALPHDVCDSL
jgi:hypothetical protein